MSRQPTVRFTRKFTPCLLVALCALSAPAFAQDSKPSDAPLGGPGVTDRAPPGGRKFGGEAGKGDKFSRAGGVQAHGAFMRTLRQLGGPDAPEGLAMSKEQIEKVRAVEEEYRAAMKAFREQHKDEFEALRKEAGLPEMGGPGERRGPGGPGGPDGERPERPQQRPGKSDDPKVQAARDKMRTLMEQGPKVEEFQTRQWAVLSAEQQAFVKDRMAEMQERRAERGREAGPDGPGAEGKRPGRGPGGPEGERRGPRGPRPDRGPGGPGTPPPPPPPMGDEGDDAPPPPPPEE